jgi:hypothetical protein
LYPSDAANWGQATKVFAWTGNVREHSNNQDNPRFGLRNLARALYGGEVLPDDSMRALGAFVAKVLGLCIDACQ